MSRPLPSKSGKPVVIAHRGAKAYVAENTIAAYELAIDQNCDMIEIDLHLSSDARIPITHDSTLEHFGREGEIAAHTLEELRAISHAAHEQQKAGGSWEGIPDLVEVLDRFAGRIPFNLEIKTDASHRPYPGLQRMAYDQAVQRDIVDETLFSSFSDPVLAELRTFSPYVRLALLLDPRFADRSFERAAAVGAEAVNPHFSMVTGELVEEAHSRDLAVYVYTVDDPAQMRSLFALGVDGIFSNAPDVLRQVVDQL